MNRNCESVEIVSWDKKRLELKRENLLGVSESIPINIPIAVLNVSGEFRTGKSTLLNLIISILDKLEKTGDKNKITKKDLKLEKGCLNKGKNDVNGFGWKAGNEPCTKGIRMLNRFFLIPNPSDKSQKMAVLLVDAEGLEANDSTNGSDQVLFGISNLMSSVLILNQKGLIGQSDMTNLRLLVEFCPPEKDNKNGSFCGIELLMRDYKYEEEGLENQLNEINKFKKSLFNNKGESNLDLLKGCYRYVDCFGLPHPGSDVESEDFKGNINDFDDEFKELAFYYIKELLTEKLFPTYENREEFYCLCETLNAFLSKGIPQLSQMHKIFIENKNQMVLNKINDELINPLKEKLNKNNLTSEQLIIECNAVSKKIEVYEKKFQGTKEMIKEKMDLIHVEVEILKKECEQRKYHELQLKLLEEEKNKTEDERKEIEKRRLEYEKRNRDLSFEIEKLRIEVQNIKPTEIHVEERICVIQ